MTSLAWRADRSKGMDVAVAVGLVAYGVVHLLIAYLGIRLAFGKQSNASQTGALQQLAGQPLGRVMLLAAAAGLFMLLPWLAVTATIDSRRQSGARKMVPWLTSGARAIAYAALGVSAVRVAAHSGTGGSAQSASGALMSLPAGQAAVFVVGLGIAGVGVALGYLGWTDKFLEHLEREGRRDETGELYRWLGKIGHLSKGLALAGVAALFCYAAITHDPKRSGGLDQALHELLRAPFGPAVLVVVSLGIGCFGLFCFAWARHPNR
jgi:hypothetical protein